MVVVEYAENSNQLLATHYITFKLSFFVFYWLKSENFGKKLFFLDNMQIYF